MSLTALRGCLDPLWKHEAKFGQFALPVYSPERLFRILELVIVHKYVSIQQWATSVCWLRCICDVYSQCISILYRPI